MEGRQKANDAGCFLWLMHIDALNLNATAVVLSRNPEGFERKAPHLYRHPAIRFHRGDIRNFDFPGGSFSVMIHGAVYQPPAGQAFSQVSLVDEVLKETRFRQEI